MYLKSLSLQNFRSYRKSNFTFHEGTTVVLGPNTSGKTNMLEAISYLSTGDSFRTEKDTDIIRFGQDFARITGEIEDKKLEFVITNIHKKYLVNGVSKRRADFAGNLTSVTFAPSDLDIIVGSPSLRRRVLDDVLLQTDRNYRLSFASYIKALRQRNALLEQIREQGIGRQRLEYWDNLVIENGSYISEKREELINYFNTSKKDIFDFSIFYDKNIISKDRLLKYKDAEVASGVTLVGPHRDDLSILIHANKNTANASDASESKDVKFYGSRGQQRLVILQLKLLMLSFIEKANGERPILLLDDIFSELDSGHIDLVSKMIQNQQTILTTTHSEFIDKKFLAKATIIELEL